MYSFIVPKCTDYMNSYLKRTWNVEEKSGENLRKQRGIAPGTRAVGSVLEALSRCS